MQLDIIAAAQLSDKEAEALETLHAAVCPPKPRAETMPSSREWALPQWHIMIRDLNGQLVSHVGAVTRLCLCDGKEIPIGGIGGVITHRSRRGKGYASVGISRIIEFLRLDWQVHMSLLFCAPRCGASIRVLASEISVPISCAAIRRNNAVPAQRDHGDARHETRDEMRGAGFMRPSLVIEGSKQHCACRKKHRKGG